MSVIDRVIKSYEKLWFEPILPGTPLPGFSERDMTELCHRTVELLASKKDPLLEIPYPVMVIGDIHGSIEDLMRIFRIFKPPPATRYLFLGDYVDRGDNSIEVMTILMALFCKYPDRVFLLRGNHEFSHINKIYGFHDEIIEAYRKATLWVLFQRVFSYLPLAAVLNEETFCVHGGLSPYLKTVQTIRTIKLPVTNYEGAPLISDLVWSDPSDQYDEYASNTRGSGTRFGKKAVATFLAENNLKFLVRGHQCTTTGVHAFAGTLGMTVFSCSDYCRLLDNRSGAIQFRTDGEVRFFSLGDDTEPGNCEKASMILVDGKIGLQKALKSYTNTKPVTIDNDNKVTRTKLRLDAKQPSQTLQGGAPPMFNGQQKNLPPAPPLNSEVNEVEYSSSEGSDNLSSDSKDDTIQRPKKPGKKKTKKNGRRKSKTTRKRAPTPDLPSNKRQSVNFTGVLEGDDEVKSDKCADIPCVLTVQTPTGIAYRKPSPPVKRQQPDSVSEPIEDDEIGTFTNGYLNPAQKKKKKKKVANDLLSEEE